jgi:hypothetical protein
VLEARVVELHNVLAGSGVQSFLTGETAGEVDMNDVKAPRAQAEVAGLNVDHHLIPSLDATDEPHVGDRLPTLDLC